MATLPQRPPDRPVRVFIVEGGDHALVADLNLRTDSHGINLYINDAGQMPNPKNQLSFSLHATGQVNHKVTKIDGTKIRDLSPNARVPTSGLTEAEEAPSTSLSTLGLDWKEGPPPPVPNVVDIKLVRRALPSDVLVVTPYLVPLEQANSFAANYRTSERYHFIEVALESVPYGAITLFVAIAAPSPSLLEALRQAAGADQSTPVDPRELCPCDGGLLFEVCHGLHSTAYVHTPVSALIETADGNILFTLAGDTSDDVTYMSRADDDAVFVCESEYLG